MCKMKKIVHISLINVCCDLRERERERERGGGGGRGLGEQAETQKGSYRKIDMQRQ